MSAHVLLILLNKFGKRDKMRGLPTSEILLMTFNKVKMTDALIIAVLIFLHDIKA